MALQPTQRINLTLGVPLQGTGGSGSGTTNAAANRYAVSFIAYQGKTLDSVRFYVPSIGGSPIAANAVCDLFSDSAAGIPNASIESKTAAANPAANTWINFTGFTTALTAGTRYWFVIKNVNATPATNFFTIAHCGSGTLQGAYGCFQSATQGWGWNKLESTNSGTSWGSAAQDNPIMRIKFSDGTYDGVGVQSTANLAAASSIFDKREVGSVFTVPAYLKAYVRRVALMTWKTGTPSGNLRFRIYRDSTLLGTSYTIPQALVKTGSDLYEQAFSSSILISGGETIRVVVGVSATGDTNANRYNLQEWLVENDADSKLLKPFNGTLSRTETADNTAGPVVFTDTDTSYIPFVLGLDTAQAFEASGISYFTTGMSTAVMRAATR